MRRRDFAFAATGVAAGALQGCSAGRRSAGVRELAISLADHLSLSPFHLAVEKGYFREAGFRITIARMNNPQALPLLAGGKLDAAIGGLPSAVFNAVIRGMNIRIVAGREFVNPGCGDSFSLFVNRAAFGNGPLDPRRLRGKRFCARLRGITEFVLDQFLAQAGIPANEVTKVDLPLSEALAALAAHRVDALLELELAHSPLAVSPDIVRLWRLADVLPGHQFSFVLFGDSLLRAEDDAGARFLAAYLTGAQEFLNGETPRFMRDFALKHKLDLRQAETACRETFARDGSIDPESVRRVAEWNVARGYVTELVAVSRLIDGRFIEAARRLLVTGKWRVA